MRRQTNSLWVTWRILWDGGGLDLLEPSGLLVIGKRLRAASLFQILSLRGMHRRRRYRCFLRFRRLLRAAAAAVTTGRTAPDADGTVYDPSGVIH